MEIQNSKNPELAKLYFMGFSTKEKRESGLQEYILKLKKHYDMLNALCKEAEKFKVLMKIRIFFIISLMQLDMEKIL